MFDAHGKRKAVNAVLHVKDAIISGLYANTNIPAEKIGQAVQDAIDNAQQAVDQIYGHIPPSEFKELDWDNPFFAAIKRPWLDTSPEAAAEAVKRFEAEGTAPSIEVDQGAA